MIASIDTCLPDQTIELNAYTQSRMPNKWLPSRACGRQLCFRILSTFTWSHEVATCLFVWALVHFGAQSARFSLLVRELINGARISKFAAQISERHSKSLPDPPRQWLASIRLPNSNWPNWRSARDRYRNPERSQPFWRNRTTTCRCFAIFRLASSSRLSIKLLLFALLRLLLFD